MKLDSWKARICDFVGLAHTVAPRRTFRDNLLDDVFPVPPRFAGRLGPRRIADCWLCQEDDGSRASAHARVLGQFVRRRQQSGGFALA
jgi:hypothetical protein